MWLLWIILVTLSGIVTCQVWNQATLDDFSKNLKLRHNVLDNTRNTGSYQAEIVLQNDGFGTLSKHGNWSLHFDSIYMIEPDTMLVGNLPNSDGAVVEGQGVKVHHEAGTHFWLEPTEDFFNLPPGKERTVKYTGANWMIAKTDFMPRWYLAAPGLTAKVLESTDDESLGFVGDFKSAKQWKRYSTDQYNPYTPQYRFDRNFVADSGDVRVVPSPRKISTDMESNVVVDAKWKVYALSDVQEEAKFLIEATKMAAAGPDVDTNVIKLSTGDVQLSGDVIKGSPDAYHLKVDTAQRVILIRGQNASGVFYGVQTLLSLMSEGGVVYKTEIWDAPRFEFRGMHLDVARNFRSKEDVKRLLDVMAMYKLNKFHFHLTDDEAWRLQIPGLPELTDVGSKRCLDPTETKCLTTQLGSGPSSTFPGSGHYTVDDYKEILRYAHKRHIQIIPEVDMPGHARSAIKSMEARYKKLKAASEVQKAVEYRLVDDADESRYLSVQMFTDNAINPCVKSTYNFIDHVVQQIKLMHQDIQPLKIFHFGGDEVARGAWENSTKCRELQNTSKVKTAAIKEYFFKRVTNITMKYGLDIMAWEDGLMRDSKTPYDLKHVPNGKVYANAWDNVWEWGSAGRAYTLANDGYQVVMSQATHLYFDHPYEPDPVERGYYWAPRFIDTQKTFGFMPKNLYGNIDVRRSGIPLKKEEVCLADGSGCPPLTATDNIVGMQGHLWSETARTSQQMDYMIFPRMLALAERAWHQAPWELRSDKLTRDREMRSDWEIFARAVGRREFGRLDKLGVKYRIPPPGAKLVGDVMKTTSGYPGLDVQYSTDNGKNWNLATDDVIVKDKTIVLRTRSADKRRFSRTIIFNRVAHPSVSDQTVVNYIAKNIQLGYSVLDNFVDDTANFLAQITLKNIGTEDVIYGNWAIWFCNIYPIVDSFPGGKMYELYKIKFVHVQGCLHRLEPVSGFQTIRPDEKRIIKFKIQFWSVSRTDVMPNWYVAADGMKSVTIASTAGQSLSFVGDFDVVNKWKRYKKDRFDPYTPIVRFLRYADAKDMGKAQSPVIPTPLECTVHKDQGVSLKNSGWKIVADSEFQKEAEFLSKSLASLGYPSVEISSSKPNMKFIELKKMDPDVQIDGKKSSSPEAYSIIVSSEADSIVIASQSRPGAFYGVQTVIGLALRNSGNVPEMTLKDSPRFGFRGMHIDVARNFHSKEAVLRHLDVMSTYKLNKFHFHLTDDEGWRLEIPGLPELTQIGGNRCDDVTEMSCLLSTLGSGPDNSNSGSGFFNVTEYQDILAYAAERHIEVIPEIDMPGHAHAAIKSMEARTKKYTDMGDYSTANANTLIDPADPSVYESVQMYNDNAVNPCINTTYNFIKHVITELVKMHASINPLKTFHFGGDEVSKGAWVNSTFCESLVNSVSSLKEYFTRRVASLAADKGLNLGGWEDGLMASPTEPFKRTDMPNSVVYGNAWDNVWEWGAAGKAYALANADYKVVLSQASHMYFDHPYEPDPEERGFYWAPRYTDTEKVFGFKPDDIYSNVDHTRAGDKMTRKELCGENDEKCTQLKKPENILATHLYFDHPYEPDPVERGYYWAPRFIDTQKTFGFMPKNLYGNIDVRRSGIPLKKEEVCLADGSGCPPLTATDNIVGMQGHLWSETARTSQQMDYMIFPRMLALAERAWHQAPWELRSDKLTRDREMRSDWEIFARAVGRREFGRLDKLGVKYRIPPPGAKLVGDVMKTTSGYPGLDVQYSTDNGKNWNLATDDVIVKDKTIVLRTRSADKRRFSRTIIFNRVAHPSVSDQTVVNYIAKNIQLGYSVLDNFVDDTANFLAQITLKNIGTEDVIYGNWAIWFCNIYPIVDSFPGGKMYELYKIKFVHVQGCLHRLEPVSGFQTIRPDEKRIIKFKIQFWSVSRTDVMPNWYVAADGMKSVTIASTAGQSLSFVGDFDVVNKWKRYKKDRFDPYTPIVRFLRYADAKDMGKAQSPVIPTPLECTVHKDQGVSLKNSGWKIVADSEFQKEAEFLSKSLASLGYPSVEISSSKPNMKFIELKKMDPDVQIDGKKSSSPEAYSIIVSSEADSIVIASQSRPGAFYGVQTVIGLALRNSGNVPEMTLKDSPRFGFRGMHIDVARNFHSKEAVLRHLDVMSTYKLNKFHFHLTDDEGWRLEIPGLPELTQIGGNRCDDVTEMSCLLSTLGSGPDNSNSGSGFFNVTEYQDILAYAAERHIEVIPEIDMPGHAHAAIKSMEARTKKYTDMGDYSTANANTLIDPADPSVYESVQMYNDNAVNPCINTTYNFIKHVITELVKMHASINPLKTFHFGGDEVSKGAWVNSTFCESLVNSVSSLKEYFTRRVASLAADKGLNLGGWEDGLMASPTEPFKRTDMPNSVVYGNAWDNVWEWGAAGKAYALANADYKVVLSQASHMYFDHPYEPDPEERGFYWAPRYTDTEKVFGFKPDDIYSNVDHTRAGDKMTRKELCGENDEKCTQLKKPENILGMQGQLWSETVRTDEQLDYMIYPRLIALAERAWHKASWESISDVSKQLSARRADWTRFANTIGYQELSFLDQKNVTYRLPPPGARIKDNKLLVNSRFPGLKIEVSFNNGQSWLGVGDDGISVNNDQTVMLATKSPDNKRRSRAIKVHVNNLNVSTASTTSAWRSIVVVVFCFVLPYVMISASCHN